MPVDQISPIAHPIRNRVPFPSGVVFVCVCVCVETELSEAALITHCAFMYLNDSVEIDRKCSWPIVRGHCIIFSLEFFLAFSWYFLLFQKGEAIELGNCIDLILNSFLYHEKKNRGRGLRWKATGESHKQRTQISFYFANV